MPPQDAPQGVQPYGQPPGQPMQPYGQPPAMQYTGGNVVYEQGAVGAPATQGGIFGVMALVIAILAFFGALIGLIPIPYVGGLLTILAMGTGFFGLIFAIVSFVTPSSSKTLGAVAMAISGFVIVIGIVRLLVMRF
jgi:hypothetical protein